MLKDHYIARARRIALHMTQSELGDLIGKSGAWVSLFERGRIDDQSMIPDIFNVLSEKSSEYTVDDLLMLIAKADLILIDIYKRYDREVPKEALECAKKSCERFGRCSV